MTGPQRAGYDEIPTIEECRALLEPHRKRVIRRFMIEPDRGNHGDTRLYDALWDLIYDGTPALSHDMAVAVERELRDSARTVGEILDGWKPEALALGARNVEIGVKPHETDPSPGAR